MFVVEKKKKTPVIVTQVPVVTTALINTSTGGLSTC